MTTIHTVKTSFKKVFNGTETHLERFRNLVTHINRLTILVLAELSKKPASSA